MLFFIFTAGSHQSFWPQALGIPIYLDPKSNFPSGSLSRDWLERHTQMISTQDWIQIQIGANKKAWIESYQCISKLDFTEKAYLNKPTVLRDAPNESASSTREWPPETPVLILKRNIPWYWVENLSNFKKTWVNEQDLTSFATDENLVSVLAHTKIISADTEVRTNSNENSFLTAKDTFYKLIKKEPNQSLIRDLKNNKLFYVNNSRYFGSNNLNSQKCILRSRASGFTYQNPNHHSLKLSKLSANLTPYLVIKKTTQQWGYFKQSGEGSFWWSFEDSENHKTKKIKTSELLKRKIFDMVSNPQNQNVRLASARGIFISSNGMDWQNINFFKSENHPLSASTSGVLFVGPYKSYDQGQSFQLYFSWESVLPLLQAYLKQSPRFLKIKKIQPTDSLGQMIHLELDLGAEIPVWVQTQNGGRNWSILTNPKADVAD